MRLTRPVRTFQLSMFFDPFRREWPEVRLPPPCLAVNHGETCRNNPPCDREARSCIELCGCEGDFRYAGLRGIAVLRCAVVHATSVLDIVNLDHGAKPHPAYTARPRALVILPFMFRRLEGLLIFLLCLAWFAFLTPWGAFTDADAFYHAHMARLILEQGPLTAFPWLDLTTVGQHFVDHHLLFHILLIPAVMMMDVFHPGGIFNDLWAAQLTIPLFAAGATLALWWILHRLDQQNAWLWTLLTLLVPGYSFRMLLGKASPLAVGLFILGIGIFVLTKRNTLKRPFVPSSLLPYLPFFFTGFLFSISHGGWIILLAAIGMMIVGDVFLQRFGEDTSWPQAIHHAPWMAGWMAGAGVIGGFIIHPNRNELFQFLWVQVVRIGIAPPHDVRSGLEWLPATPIEVISGLASLLIALCVGVLCVVLTVKRSATPEQREAFRRVILLALPVALTLPLTLKSSRFIEYLAPAFALWMAAFWALVEPQQIRAAFQETLRAIHPLLRKAVPLAAGLLVMLVATHQTRDVWNELRRPGTRPFAAYRATLAAITQHAQPGDRVFHSNWDEFPTLFAADDRLRYVSGLDPVFLHDAHPRLSHAIQDLTQGLTSETLWNVIVEQTDARFVFITLKHHSALNKALESDKRFQNIAQDPETAAYKILR